MSSKKVLNRRSLIIKVAALSLLPLLLFGWYLYNQLNPSVEVGKSIVQSEKKEDKKELPDLPEPEKPKEEEEESEKEKTPEVKPEPPKKQNWWEYPSPIVTTTRSGDDLLVLVNKKYKLPSSYAPKDLVSVGSAGIRVKSGGTFHLRTIVIPDLKEMVDKAKEEGIDISVISAYRSYSTQASTYQYWVNYNGGNTDAADTVSARPGHSQHQLGTAMDFSSNEIGDRLGDEFGSTKASKWLVNNSWKYGFVLAYPKGYEVTTGYSYESWHYRYIGKVNAVEWKASGQILELWLRSKN